MKKSIFRFGTADLSPAAPFGMSGELLFFRHFVLKILYLICNESVSVIVYSHQSNGPPHQKYKSFAGCER